MLIKDTLPSEAFWLEDSFNFIKAEEFGALGIDEGDIPAGTFPAFRHPSQIPSRFGGNAYGFGFFEVYDRLHPREVALLQSINFQDEDHIKANYQDINRIYKSIGLLKRFSKNGKPYYLIPYHLVSTSLSNIRSKADEITKIIDFHRTKYFKENHRIGLLTHADDLLVNELSIRFKDHQFFVFDSFEKLRGARTTLDLIILPKDLFMILFTEKFLPRSGGNLSKGRVENYVFYMLGKIYNLLKPDGEFFIIANRIPLKTNQTITVNFHSEQEQKNFLFFSHIFRTRKKYQIKGRSTSVNVFDFQKYLNPPYVEKEALDGLLRGQNIDTMSIAEINNLPHLNFPLQSEFIYDQDKIWTRTLSNYFDKIFLKPLFPDPIRKEWRKRFAIRGYTPGYMLIYLGQKKPLGTSLSELAEEVRTSRLAGCPLSLLSDYKNTFDYAIRTLNVLKKIKGSTVHTSLPELFMERLKEPLENKKKRYPGLNDVMRLMTKVNRLKRIKEYLNPDGIEGPTTPLLGNLESLSLYGFGYGELRELFLIVVGHTPMGRILSGKMNEKSLKPVSDLARSYSPLQALNLLRFCRIMSMAETVASKKTDLNQEELAELFDLYENMVKVETNRDMDWDRLLDEKISSRGGIHNEIVRKLLKMMNLSQFLENWHELRTKGPMEKEVLADYDEERLEKIESVIELLSVVDTFEDMYLREDPLQLSIFFRKILNLEFHGTVHFFELINSRLVFILLWITVNVVRGDIINFNGVLANVTPDDMEDYLKRMEDETGAVNIHYLDFKTLKRLQQQVYENKTAFIVGTGFQLKYNPKTQALEVGYIDIKKNIQDLSVLSERWSGRQLSEIPVAEMKHMQRLFSNLESFYQSHLTLLSQEDADLRLPARQKKWSRRAKELRDALRAYFIRVVFEPENIYTNLFLLLRHAPSILSFVLPEFMALREIPHPDRGHLKSPLMGHILGSIRRLQALIRGDRKSFQDAETLHKLAQREFGPLAAGIVGLSESQIEILEGIAKHLQGRPAIFDAMVKSFIFRDIGLIPELREKYRDQINPADHAHAGALFLEKERIPQRYDKDPEIHRAMVYLVKNHNLLHHVIRGEFSLYAIKDAEASADKDLFDAFFLSSFTMFTSLREDLVLEDLANRLFQYRSLSHRLIDGVTTPEKHLRDILASKGHLFRALENHRRKGLPKGMSPAQYLESYPWEEQAVEDYIRSGKMIYALERILRLRGIRYVEFPEMAALMVKVPLKYIYQKRIYIGIGYASFERELFEAIRMYNSLQQQPEEVRHFVLSSLVKDDVRIFGFEAVSTYLNYDNIIKLLFIAILGSRRFDSEDSRPTCLSFLELVIKIERRYESVNSVLSFISLEDLWKKDAKLDALSKQKSGLLIRTDPSRKLISFDFVDKINISEKISYMMAITDLEQLKNYYHYSLRSLRKYPYYTDDYELELERAFDTRMENITGDMIDQAKNQMTLLRDFKEIHNLYSDMMEHSLDIGFSDEQRHRLSDLYELRKDTLRNEKLGEIEAVLSRITDMQELEDYWDSIKWSLQKNRLYSGKEFETLVSRRFDEAMKRMVDKGGS